jgi:hypothetical protein
MARAPVRGAQAAAAHLRGAIKARAARHRALTPPPSLPEPLPTAAPGLVKGLGFRIRIVAASRGRPLLEPPPVAGPRPVRACHGPAGQRHGQHVPGALWLYPILCDSLKIVCGSSRRGAAVGPAPLRLGRRPAGHQAPCGCVPRGPACYTAPMFIQAARLHALVDAPRPALPRSRGQGSAEAATTTTERHGYAGGWQPHPQQCLIPTPT